MPLPPPAARTPLHKRRLTIDGFEREDGLYDIEGRIVDTKPYRFKNRDRVINISGKMQRKTVHALQVSEHVRR